MITDALPVPGSETACTAMDAMADGLTSHGLDIRGAQWDGSRYLKITNAPGVLSEVTICDNGTVEWEYRLCHDTQAAPAHFTTVALEALGANSTHEDTAALAHGRNLTLKGMVGSALGQLGMDVSLNIIFKDEVFFEVFSEIEATNPQQPSRGRVRVADDNSLKWECRISGQPGGVSGTTLSEVAETISRALTGSAGGDR